MNGRTDSRTRSLVLLAVLAIAGLACTLRLGYWQLLDRADLTARARDQVSVRATQEPIRGSVYDRSGTVVLATTVERDRLVAFPANLKATTDEATRVRRDTVATRLSAILGLDAAGGAALRAQLESDKPYLILATGLTAAESGLVRAGIADGSLPQVRLEPSYERIYSTGGAPHTSIASQLLGFVNREGSGQYGLEARWQAALAGSPQVILALRDGSGRPALETGTVVEQGSPGADLVLTIDASLQLKVEQEVYAAAVADRAKSVSAVVMDPVTGEILASATYPAYDANAYPTIAARHPGLFLDQTISTTYEPGSVFKMVTAAAALESGVVRRSTKIADQAVLVLDHGKAQVRNADRGSKGRLSFQDGVAWSRNVIMSKVALRLGSTTRRAATVLFRTWSKLGFGRPTGVDLAGEVGGIVRDPAVNSWAQVDLANGSFGQGVAVTLLQLATAYCAMVNGGTLPVPHVVRSVGGTPVDVAAPARVLTPKLSADLIAIMKRVVTAVPYYTSRTEIPGYLVGGKTGTAQIWDSAKRRWRSDVYDFSFAGFVGRTAPDLVIAVRITEGRPKVNRPGNLVNAVESFELFRRVATDAMSTLDLPPVGATTVHGATRRGAQATPVATPRTGAIPTPKPTRRPGRSAPPTASGDSGADATPGSTASP